MVAEKVKCQVQRLADMAIEAGWSLQQSYDWEKMETNKQALLVGDSRYPTLRTPDGSVAIGLSNNDIYYHKDRVWVSDGMGNTDKVVIAGIYVEPSNRRNGLARDAMELLISWAGELGITLMLEPCPIATLEPGKLASAHLAKWYKSMGFKQMVDGTDRILVK